MQYIEYKNIFVCIRLIKNIIFVGNGMLWKKRHALEKKVRPLGIEPRVSYLRPVKTNHCATQGISFIVLLFILLLTCLHAGPRGAADVARGCLCYYKIDGCNQKSTNGW
jgi:hypothetical protein